MKIPEKIKIGYKTYSILHSAPVLAPQELYGQIDYNSLIITLREENSHEQDEATLIHEVLHGIAEMYNLDLNEDVVERLGSAIYTVMVDNNILLERKEE